MGSTPHSPLHREISGLAVFISIGQLIASPISVGISHLIHPYNVLFDVKDILDFLAISFPLTVSIAILFVLILKGKFNLFYLFFAVAGAALLSNLLHWVVGEIFYVDLNKTFTATYNSSPLRWIYNIFAVYWKTFGPIPFIQSCCIGIYAGYRYLKIEESKNARK